MKVVQVKLTKKDWIRVVHAIDSSMQRKMKRGDGKGFDEMGLIGRSIINQVNGSTKEEKHGLHN